MTDTVRVTNQEWWQIVPDGRSAWSTLMLTDTDIAARVRSGDIGLDPFNPDLLQPASYDLTLANGFLVARRGVGSVDLSDIPENLTEPVHLDDGQPFVLHPGEFALASTAETVSLPCDLIARVDGKSSLGRTGLLVHLTAGFIDPGFVGAVTLELFNAAPWQMILRPGMRIAQIGFTMASGKVLRPYGHPELGSKYQHQKGATPAKGTR